MEEIKKLTPEGESWLVSVLEAIDKHMENKPIACEKCGIELVVGQWPFCPHPMGANSVISDSIPGGIEIRHGICWPDGTPRKYYSHSEMDKEAKRLGLVNAVRHTSNPKSGSDKSKLTTKWV